MKKNFSFKKIGKITGIVIVSVLALIGLITCFSLLMHILVKPNQQPAVYTYVYTGDQVKTERWSSNISAFRSPIANTGNSILLRVWSMHNDLNDSLSFHLNCTFSGTASDEEVPRMDELWLIANAGDSVVLRPWRVLTTANDSGSFLSGTMSYTVDDEWINSVLPDTIAEIGFRKPDGILMTHPCNADAADRIRNLYELIKQKQTEN